METPHPPTPTPHIFLIQFLFKIDVSALWSLPPSPVHIPYSILIQNWWEYSLNTLSPSSRYSLFNYYSKLMKILPGASIHIPYSILIQNWWKCSGGASRLPQYIFLIQFLFKINENPLWSFLPPQYIFLIQFLFKIDETLLWRPHPPPVLIPYSIRIQNWWKSSL